MSGSGKNARQFSFKYREKLHLQSDFNAVFKKGIKFENRFIKIFAYKRQAGALRRMGLVVSRKVGNAPQRNLAKRRLREIFRTNKNAFPAGIDIIFIPNSKTPKVKYKILKQAVLEMMSKL
ncbi:MAG: ribonuclease P protein component [Elusimicrobiota bacterium]|jgi:ribonuclease P protein component|nr:ribonuclease P protein component [Elusimicrobiota bacterium]